MAAGLGVRVALKPEYRITPPPQLSPQVADIPRSNFRFDFEFERKILAEADKESMNWSKLGLENFPPKPNGTTSSMGANSDPVVSKYIASGFSREVVTVAVGNYGDNPTKVQEFVTGYNLLREMGFSSNNVAEALLMSDNDTDKALAHFLNSSS
ncbi:HAT transposon superfamily isoform 1 [Hibiscus syriacus]|uniref:HAT transposon superfamily isoform 1 n=1 Tax=Hibiscus syriacus TaxID=106335 RepID=A0A6A3A6M0_HIBSY|nr:HAT transposon superfamily isoform 1 [Hibiscus syriacus]